MDENNYRYNPSQTEQRPRSAVRQSGSDVINHSSTNRNMNKNEAVENEKKRLKRRMLLKKRKHNKKFFVTVGVCALISIVLSVISISLLNDVLAINRSSDIIEVEIDAADDDDLTTNKVVAKLDKAGLIKNRFFCMVAARILGYSNKGYRSGVYNLSPSMGLENMLENIKNKNSSAAKTTTITFPEGYTINQILDLLETNHVCTREKMLKAMNETDFSEDFEFLKGLTDKENRYYALEGYFYPDTYEFYLGESADSVIEKFLSNFENKWTEMYDMVAAERGLSLDQVIKYASIVQKEATSEDQRLVSSILINRIDAGMQLQCDSTKDYEYGIANDTNATYSSYNGLYNTYICAGLPVAPICNPGDDAISAVLYANDTEYLYFYHDSNNVIHCARTLSGHNENIVNYP